MHNRLDFASTSDALKALISFVHKSLTAVNALNIAGVSDVEKKFENQAVWAPVTQLFSIQMPVFSLHRYAQMQRLFLRLEKRTYTPVRMSFQVWIILQSTLNASSVLVPLLVRLVGMWQVLEGDAAASLLLFKCWRSFFALALTMSDGQGEPSLRALSILLLVPLI